MNRFCVWVLCVAVLAAQPVPDLFIVELAGEPLATFTAAVKGRREAAADRRARIQAEQQSVREALAQVNAEVLGAMDTVANALIVRIADAQADQLRSIPAVARVHRVYEVKLYLDHALPLMAVPDGWLRIGGMEQAGLGVKIGIIDTGIDQEHPAFQDSSLPVPPGYPMAGKAADLAFTNNKIIVGRTYEDLLGAGGDANPRDAMGHGTAVAMAAAGVPTQAPLALITGVAPKAYLGNYKVFAGDRETTRSDVILKAIDDAVADGMNVINLSVGSPLAPRPADSISAQAVERAAAAGVIVVTAAGNEGPDPNTINSYATAASAIGVGASWNDRSFAPGSVTLEGVLPYAARPAAGLSRSEPITAPLLDVSQLDQDGLACNSFPEGSLSGRIAFILRGTCLFEDKLNNAQQAGAVAAVLYTHAQNPELDFSWSAGAATLPATMLSYADGLDVKKRLAGNSELSATLNFTTAALPVNSNRVASFSSRGPNPDDAIKPDLLGVGTYIYTATQRGNAFGEMYDESGFTTESGTSFAAPLVAGAAAVLKAARPGLTNAQYRSLLINSASPFRLDAGQLTPVQRAGAGRLNLDAGLKSTVAAYPTSVSFGIGGGTIDRKRRLTISNLDAADDTFTISVVPAGDRPAPFVASNTVQLAPGASETLDISFTGADLGPGEYQGILRIQGTRTDLETRVPYWYAVPSGVPAYLTVLSSRDSGLPGSLLREAFCFRVTDASGIPVLDVQPNVTAASGGGEVVRVASIDEQVPGAYAVNVRLGMEASRNAFQIRVGELERTVTILGTNALQP